MLLRAPAPDVGRQNARGERCDWLTSLRANMRHLVHAAIGSKNFPVTGVDRAILSILFMAQDMAQVMAQDMAQDVVKDMAQNKHCRI